MKLAGTRLRNHPSRKGLTVGSDSGPVWTGEVRFNEQWLSQPFSWGRPRNIFVCAHSDLFHPEVPYEWIDQIFAVMALASRHTFQVLTKRPERMREYVSMWFERLGTHEVMVDHPTGRRPFHKLVDWAVLPSVLPNVWFGTSVERQKEADERIPRLLATPAVVRFISAEPLLGPMDIQEYLTGLGWVIVGGESAADAKPMHPDWARSLRDQCASAEVPFLFKQWGSCAQVSPGEWTGEPDHSIFVPNIEPGDWWVGRDGYVGLKPPRMWAPADFAIMRNIGKGKAGRLLDGVEHNGMPIYR
jgi:protein gp37